MKGVYQGELGALLLIKKKKASRIDELKQLDEFSLNRTHHTDHPQAQAVSGVKILRHKHKL
jgi:hypothetical protein